MPIVSVCVALYKNFKTQLLAMTWRKNPNKDNYIKIVGEPIRDLKQIKNFSTQYFVQLLNTFVQFTFFEVARTAKLLKVKSTIMI